MVHKHGVAITLSCLLDVPNIYIYIHYTIMCTHVAHEDLPRTGCISNLGAVSRYQAGLDKLRAIIQGNLGFIFATMLGQESDPVTKPRKNEVKLG